MKTDNEMFEGLKELNRLQMDYEKYQDLWLSLSSKIQDEKPAKGRFARSNNLLSVIPVIAAVLVVGAGIGTYQYQHVRSAGNSSMIKLGETANNTEVPVTTSVGKNDGLPQGWYKVGTKAPNALISLVYVQGTLYGYAESGVLWSFRDGIWNKQSNMPKGVVSITASGGRLYCATASGVWVYQNGTWVLSTGSPQDASVLMDVRGELYVGVDTGSDGGSTNKGVWVHSHSRWSVVGDVPSRVISLIDVRGKYYASMETGVWSYTNGKWMQTPGAPKYIQSMADVNGVLYATSGNFVSGIWTYYQGEWMQKTQSKSNMVINCLQNVNGRLYAGTNSGVWLYENGIWTQENPSLGNVLSLTSSNGVLYASTTKHGVQSTVVK